MELQELEDRYTELKLDFKQYIVELCNNIVDNDNELLVWEVRCGNILFTKKPTGNGFKGHSFLTVDISEIKSWEELNSGTWYKLKVIYELLETEIAKTVMWEKEEQ